MLPVTEVTIQAVCSAIVAICRTIDGLNASLTPELRQKQAELQIEQLKPWIELARWMNRGLGLEK